MATYEQAMEALRRADAEGNVEDAQKLAEIASKLRPEGAGGGRGLWAALLLKVKLEPLQA